MMRDNMTSIFLFSLVSCWLLICYTELGECNNGDDQASDEKAKKARNEKLRADTIKKLPEIQKFRDECLAAHNAMRKLHSANDLKESKSLDTKAAYYGLSITHVVETQGIRAALRKHYVTLRNPLYGSAMGVVKRSDIWRFGEDKIDGGWPVRFWYYKEFPHHFHNRTSSDYSPASQHFSQMVWRNTTELGVHYHVSERGHIILTFMYKPTGNIKGQYREMVRERTDLKRGKDEKPAWDSWLEDEKYQKYHTGNLKGTMATTSVFKAWRFG